MQKLLRFSLKRPSKLHSLPVCVRSQNFCSVMDADRLMLGFYLKRERQDHDISHENDYE